ncbi:DUF4166 domain-containing protein [Rhizobium sp. RCC_161_2]|uniref:DUF4166 domain-containing protein n=1 Tax=Rhizobium sp. RCC_161_2 TaxID=3239219 RepID=UPI003524FD33
MSSNSTVLVIGGYGVFGGRLSRRLARVEGLDVIVAGRSLEKAAAFCETNGGRPATIDVVDGDNLEALFAQLAPAIVVDAAGPFQRYGSNPYRVAAAALRAGASYIDLSDDGAFTAGISTLDPEARKSGLVAISGASSVPAISSAAVAALSRQMTSIDFIDSVILPGNRAPRGTSVVGSILSQVGRPVLTVRGNGERSVRGWSERRHETLSIPGVQPVPGRRSHHIGAPDTFLFPRHFGAANVSFRAGLELAVMNAALSLAGLAVAAFPRLRLERLSGLLVRIADAMRGLGTDRGGMRVEVGGLSADGTGVKARWTLIAGHGDGPEVPTIPAYLLTRMILGGRIEPGARACVGEIAMEDIETVTAELGINTHSVQEVEQSLFERVLGENFAALPSAIRRVHDSRISKRLEGRATVTRGDGIVAKLIGMAFGFPGSGDDIPTTVTIERRGDKETWTRQFGSAAFRSYLSPAPGNRPGGVTERFGLLSFDIDLGERLGRLYYPVVKGRIGPIPLPRFLTPRSDTVEQLGLEDGRFHFSVNIDLPFFGHLVSYSGWLADPMAPLDVASEGYLRSALP